MVVSFYATSLYSNISIIDTLNITIIKDFVNNVKNLYTLRQVS